MIDLFENIFSFLFIYDPFYIWGFLDFFQSSLDFLFSSVEDLILFLEIESVDKFFFFLIQLMI